MATKAILLLLITAASLCAQRPGGGPPPGRPAGPTPNAATTAPAPTPLEDLASVEGQVTNAATAEPLRKASVSLRRANTDSGSGPRSYLATSNSLGAFFIPNVEPGQYRLSVSRNGFVDLDYGSRDYLRSGQVFTLGVRQRMSNILLAMTPNAVVTGKVVDEDGDPMNGARVQALRYRYTNGRKQLVEYGSASTNDIGEYRIPGLPPGRYFVSVSARRRFSDRVNRVTTGSDTEDYVRTYYPNTVDPAAAAPLDLAPGAELRGADVALSKKRTFIIHGRAIDASGSTPAGGRSRIMVFLAARDVLAGTGGNRPASLDASGTFEIRGVPAGQYNLTAAVQARGGSLVTRIPVDVGSANLDNLRITVNPFLTVTGRVRIENATTPPPANMVVSLRAREAAEDFLASSPLSKVAEDGSFSVPLVNPERYSLAVTGMPDGYYVKSVRLNNQDTPAVDIDLSHGGTPVLEVLLSPNGGAITGAIQTDQQQPAAGATVVLIPQEPDRRDQPQFYRTTTTDDSGHYGFSGLVPGQYKVYAWPYIESGAYYDPDFLRPFENRGEPVTIRESANETVPAKLIS